MRNYSTKAIIIKRRNFREIDRLLTIFTEKHGKIQIKAQGVRKITSRRSPHVELLNLSLLTLYKGSKSSLPLLIEAQTIENFSLIKSDLTKVGFAYHICELIDGLCPENQENKRVFDLLQNSLCSLAKTDSIAETIHEFEVELLTILGFWSKVYSAKNLDTQYFIENILERRLKSKKLLAKFGVLGLHLSNRTI